MSVNPEQIAVDALKDWLLGALPARVAALNAANVAVVKSRPGPFTLAAGTLLIGTERGTTTSVTIAGGSYTASDLATAINGTPVSGVTASADADGRLVLTASTAPSVGTDSVVCVGANDNNAALGWHDAGEYVVRSALVAPDWKQLRDGWPAAPPDGANNSFIIIFEDRTAQSVAAERHYREMHTVTVHAMVLAPIGTSEVRDRRRISLAVAAIREALSGDTGRMLGNTSAGAVQLARVTSTAIAGKDLAWRGVPALFDVATVVFSVRIFLSHL